MTRFLTRVMAKAQGPTFHSQDQRRNTDGNDLLSLALAWRENDACPERFDLRPTALHVLFDQLQLTLKYIVR